MTAGAELSNSLERVLGRIAAWCRPATGSDGAAGYNACLSENLPLH
jgi:hypothetical protein